MSDADERPQDLESSNDTFTDSPEEKDWAPIRSQKTREQNAQQQSSSRASSLLALSKTRSQNGYGCDDDTDIREELGAGDGEKGQTEKDPFEVGWDNGEKDPMNPKGKKKIAKWAIVLICSVASMCV
jgi:hypothetical protein